MRLIAITCIALSLGCSSAVAHSACSLKAGDRVQTDQLDQLLAAVAGVALKKDEFETTAQFEQRKAAASLASAEFAVDLQTDHEHAVYDADRSAWVFHQYFPSGGTYNFDEEALAAAGLSGAGWSHSKMLRSIDVDEGSYVAANAYGREVLVNRVLATRIGVIEIAWGQPLPSDYMAQFDTKFEMPLTLRLPMTGLPDGLEVSAVEVPMPVEEARLEKGRFRFIVAGELVAPYRIEHTRYITPKIDNPRDVKVEMTYLVADIHCGIISTHEGKVLKVLPMVKPF